ncbi:MAG: hypothetical protein FJ077_02435 [Cyanobacteria bacterium K_DeepCast_35m_m2_023]|nr:hypothetical protein [Cyanobacteria bacterium K_DeepCast_35m_m2_023]
MASESVSFRITRSTEDLAQTIHALSHRLVRLEQKLAALELEVEGFGSEPSISPQEISSLDNVERLLHDCRSLLDEPAELAVVTPVAEQRDAA